MGAAEFVEKPFEPDVLVAPIRRALSQLDEDHGRTSRAEADARRIAALSGRERDVLQGVLKGRSNKEIARELAINPRSVEVYRAKLMTKMHVGLVQIRSCRVGPASANTASNRTRSRSTLAWGQGPGASTHASGASASKAARTRASSSSIYVEAARAPRLVLSPGSGSISGVDFSKSEESHSLYMMCEVYEEVMPRQLSAPFFSDTPVFDRAAYARAVGRAPSDRVVSAMLDQHLRAGNIVRIARGVFAAVPKHADPKTWSVDRFLAASKLRRGGVIGYHSALELHGYAYSEGYEVQVIAAGQPLRLEAAGVTCRFVRPPRGLMSPDAIAAVDRLGVLVPVTTLERTLADLFDRPDLAGGGEELLNSLDLVPRVDAAKLRAHVVAIGNATAAGICGWWLETAAERLRLQPSAIDAVRPLAPRQPRYALGAKPGDARLISGWDILVPAELAARRFEGA